MADVCAHLHNLFDSCDVRETRDTTGLMGIGVRTRKQGTIAPIKRWTTSAEHPRKRPGERHKKAF